MANVSIRQLNKKYDNGFHAVKDVNLEIRDKEFLVLVGPSGCGKTTTLRMVAGFIAPTSGSIRLGGRDITGVPAHKRDAGLVFQNYALFPHLTAAENIAFGLRRRGVAKAECEQRVSAIIDKLRLTGLGGRMPAQL
jgi:ABC-type Fe3+/spermidine/putrescine transport system ATPase subunit